MITQTLLEITSEPYIVHSTGAMVAIGAASGLIKGIGSLFGRKRKRRAAQKAERARNQALSKLMNFKFKNAYEGLQGASYDPVAAKAQQIGNAATAQMPTLGDATGYEAVGYKPEGYTAQGTNIGPLLTGDATGLTMSVIIFKFQPQALNLRLRKQTKL